MDYESELIPCNYENPNRCQEPMTSKFKGCFFLAAEGSTKCRMHGAAVKHIQDKAQLRAYRSAQWSSRINEFADHPNVKTLRDEIGIARMTLEVILNKCQTQSDVFIYSNKISEMLVRIEKLVVACNRLEDRLGFTLDKSAIINIGEQIINVIAVHVPEEQLETIAEQIGEVIINSSPLREKTNARQISH